MSPEQSTATPPPGAPSGRRGSRYYLLPSLLAVAFVIVALYAQQGTKAPEVSDKVELYSDAFENVMGSGCHVTLVVENSLKKAPRDCVLAALNEVKRAEKLLSYYDPQSDVSRVNAAPAGQMIPVHPLTWQALNEALRFCYLSGGAFDPATGSITRLYHWSRGQEKVFPAQDVVQKAKEAAGADNLLLQREGMLVGRKNEATRMDLGGLAQGLGTDLFISVLAENGVKNAVVEIGGEVRVMGRRPLSPEEAGGKKGTSRLWNVGLRDPRDPEAMKKLATQPGYAVSTSGDYEKYFEYKGKRYSHIIDPRTGYPLSGGVISATIVVPNSCMAADALATIACVMGERRFRELLKDFPAVEAYLITDKLQMIHLPPANKHAGATLQEEDEVSISSNEEEATPPAEDRTTAQPETLENYWPLDAGARRELRAAPAKQDAGKAPAPKKEPGIPAAAPQPAKATEKPGDAPKAPALPAPGGNNAAGR